MTQTLPREVWCLAQVKPNAESTAERNLLRQGFDVFAPKALHTGRLHGRFRSQNRALFPGYLFVNLFSDFSRWRSISSTLGVSRLVSFGNDHPSVVPSEIVDILRRRCNDPEAIPTDGLSEGDSVRIIAGPFADFVGSIESLPSTQRIWILLDIMGRARRISISARDLQLAQC
jgi:transcriptional antiterminator RfaH